MTYMVLPRGQCAGALQRMRLGVRAAAHLRPAAGDDLAGRLVGDDGADGRVGRGLPQDAVRHVQRQPHEAAILLDAAGTWLGFIARI